MTVDLICVFAPEDNEFGYKKKYLHPDEFMPGEGWYRFQHEAIAATKDAKAAPKPKPRGRPPKKAK